MKRRDLFKAFAASGLALCLPSISLQARAAADPNRFWVMVNAGGGWDPTSLCDPKGNVERSDGRGPVNNFSAADIRTTGGLRYAPYPSTITAPATDMFESFFSRHAGRLLVINGVDTQTNSHTVGNRFTWSGKSDMGHPSFAAMVAASAGATKPMAYISNGGYDFTDGLVSASRVSGSGSFSKLAYPNEPSPGNTERYFEDDIYARVAQSQANRLRQLRDDEVLLKRRQKIQELLSARTGDGNLQEIVAKLPSRISNGLRGQAEMAAAAFSAGLAVSANLNVGGFDTHGNHDQSHSNSLNTLLDGIDHLWTELERQGVADQTTVVIGSDFGRTPFYNANRGKDHWNVTSVMLMGAGIRGNRVIGQTSALYTAMPVNAQTLQPDTSGVIITPAHIHKSLRRLAGLAGTEIDQRYPVAVDELPLLS
ncbi:MAG: DUF1501 domain-containing protein [Hahellaceae bacterium]|nr:DUF1501 domain-containing protein [Hahellaceae bacterium]MCP5169131.1 DUF1501 domain-containing protein [Hahellaceae bacterium]